MQVDVYREFRDASSHGGNCLAAFDFYKKVLGSIAVHIGNVEVCLSDELLEAAETAQKADFLLGIAGSSHSS
jgi:hypothetical protein